MAAPWKAQWSSGNVEKRPAARYPPPPPAAPKPKPARSWAEDDDDEPDDPPVEKPPPRFSAVPQDPSYPPPISATSWTAPDLSRRERQDLELILTPGACLTLEEVAAIVDYDRRITAATTRRRKT